jgi:hypothetical protein
MLGAYLLPFFFKNSLNINIINQINNIMMRRTYVEAKVRITIDGGDGGVEISKAIEEMDYNFTSQTEGVNIVDTEITEYEITEATFN